MSDRARLLPFIALVVFSALSLLAIKTSETLTIAGSTPLERLLLTVNAITWGDATPQATLHLETKTLD